MGFGLRAKLKTLDESLYKTAETLWEKSKPLHDRQNWPESNENGRIHVERVEHNIWRLLSEASEKDSHKPWIEKLNEYELFILSCAACCHDLDKALKKPCPDKFIHGVGSGGFVVANWRQLGFDDEYQAKAVCSAVAIHDFDSEKFRIEVTKLKRDECTPTGTFDLKLAAVLLKTADTLHCDHSRVLTLGIDPNGLNDNDKQKYFARYSIKGWHISGNYVVIQADLDTSEKIEAFREAIKYMQEQEWSAVSDALGNLGFPHQLKLDDQTRAQLDQQPVTKPPGGSSVIAALAPASTVNISVLCPRCLARATDLAGSASLSAFLKQTFKDNFVDELKKNGAQEVLNAIYDALEQPGPRPDSEKLKELLASIAPFHVSAEMVRQGREQLHIDPAGKSYQGGVLEISETMIDGGDAIIRAALFDRPCLWEKGSLAGDTRPKGDRTINDRDVPKPATLDTHRVEWVKKRILEVCVAGDLNTAKEIMAVWLRDGEPLTVLCSANTIELLKVPTGEHDNRYDSAKRDVTDLALFLSLCKHEHMVMAGLLERLRTIGARLAQLQRTSV